MTQRPITLPALPEDDAPFPSGRKGFSADDMNARWREGYEAGLADRYTTPLYTHPAPSMAVGDAVAWVDWRNLASAQVSRERGGPFDSHVWSEGKTAIHDTPLYAGSAPVVEPAMREALQDALEFVEHYSRAWNGVSAKHPNTIATNARKALAATPLPSEPLAAAASPDVAGMVEEAKRALHEYSDLRVERQVGDALGNPVDRKLNSLQSEAMRNIHHAAIDALGAAATQARGGEAESSTFPAGLVKYASPTTALRYLAKRLRSAGIATAVADEFAESIEFLLARRDDLGEALTTQPAPALAREPLTKEEIRSCEWALSAGREYEKWTGLEILVVEGVEEFVRAIERAHGITADSARAAASEPLSVSVREVKR